MSSLCIGNRSRIRSGGSIRNGIAMYIYIYIDIGELLGPEYFDCAPSRGLLLILPNVYYLQYI